MTDQEKSEIRRMIREETELVVSAHLHVFSVACMSPICNTQAEMMKSLEMLIQGQALVEKHLAGAFREDDDWREPLD